MLARQKPKLGFPYYALTVVCCFFNLWRLCRFYWSSFSQEFLFLVLSISYSCHNLKKRLSYYTVAFNKAYWTLEIFKSTKVWIGRATSSRSHSALIYFRTLSIVLSATKQTFFLLHFDFPPFLVQLIQEQLIIYFCSRVGNAKDTPLLPCSANPNTKCFFVWSSSAVYWLLWLCVCLFCLQYKEFGVFLLATPPTISGFAQEAQFSSSP